MQGRRGFTRSGKRFGTKSGRDFIDRVGIAGGKKGTKGGKKGRVQGGEAVVSGALEPDHRHRKGGTLRPLEHT